MIFLYITYMLEVFNLVSKRKNSFVNSFSNKLFIGGQEFCANRIVVW